MLKSLLSFATVILFSLCCVAKNFSFDEILDYHVKNSEELAAQSLQVESAEAKESEAFSQIFPKLNLAASYKKNEFAPYTVPDLGSFGDSFFNTEEYFMGVELVQPLYRGGQIWNAYEVQKISNQLQKIKFLDEKQKILSEFLDLLLNYHVLSKQEDILTRSKKYQKQFTSLTRKRG